MYRVESSSIWILCLLADDKRAPFPRGARDGQDLGAMGCHDVATLRSVKLERAAMLAVTGGVPDREGLLRTARPEGGIRARSSWTPSCDMAPALLLPKARSRPVALAHRHNAARRAAVWLSNARCPYSCLEAVNGSTYAARSAGGSVANEPISGISPATAA